jgi:putative hydrolase of the HAD superfamily
MGSIEAVLFDLDETLLDRERAIEAYAGKLHADLGLGCEASAFIEAFIVLDERGYADKRGMAASLIKAFKIKKNAEWILFHWSKNAWKDLACNDGALLLLDGLRRSGRKTGIVTNGSAASQRAKIASLGLADKVGTIAISEDIGFAKPSREIFAYAAMALGLAPERCAFVGDNLEKDVVGSTQAGMKGILYDKFGRQAEAPFPRIGNLNEVLELL